MLLKAYVVPHPPIILPEVGKGQEKTIQSTIDSMDRMAREIAELNPDTIIITTPHAPMFRDGFYISNGKSAKGNFKKFGVFTVEESVSIDEELVSDIINFGSEENINFADRYVDDLDHGTLIPIRFIHKYYDNFKVVILGLSGLRDTLHFNLGRAIDKVVTKQNRRAVFIASGDLSHVLKADGPYGFEKEGPEFDEKIIEILSNAKFTELFNMPDTLTEKAAQCGLKSFQIMAGALSEYDVTGELYSYEGPFGVGYGVVGFSIKNEVMEVTNPYVTLAKNTIEEYIKYGRVIEVPDNLPDDMMTNRAGTFVTIHKNGELRGCIGTIEPTKNSVAEEIIANAISASTRDPRFPEVKVNELEDLEISVDVLKAPERINDISELDTKRYGVIVSNKYRRGLLLPNIEGVDDVEFQLSIALRKAGIRSDEPYEIERFEVIRHE